MKNMNSSEFSISTNLSSGGIFVCRTLTYKVDSYVVFISRNHIIINLERIVSNFWSVLMQFFVYESHCPHVGLGTSPPQGGIPKESLFAFTGVLEEITGNTKQLRQQAQPKIEPGIARRPVLSKEPLGHWWGSTDIENIT